MELIVIVGGVLLLDILAMRFGVDSRILDNRDYPLKANHEPLVIQSDLRRISLRIRLADGLRALAVRIEPAACVPSTRAV